MLSCHVDHVSGCNIANSIYGVRGIKIIDVGLCIREIYSCLQIRHFTLPNSQYTGAAMQLHFPRQNTLLQLLDAELVCRHNVETLALPLPFRLRVPSELHPSSSAPLPGRCARPMAISGSIETSLASCSMSTMCRGMLSPPASCISEPRRRRGSVEDFQTGNDRCDFHPTM